MLNNSKVFRTTLASVAFIFAFYVANPYLTAFLLEKGFQKQEIAYFSSLAPIILIFFSAIIGNISDNIGRKRTINTSILLLAISYFMFLLMDKNYFILTVALLLSTVSNEAIVSTSMERVEDNISDKERGRFTGIYETMRTIGILGGTIVGSYLVGVSGIGMTFKVCIFILLLVFLGGLFYKSHNHNKIQSDDFNFIKDIKAYLSNKNLRGMAIIGIGANFMVSPRNLFISVLLIQDLHASLVYIGLFTAAMSLAHLSQYYWGKRCDIHGSSTVIKYSVLIWSFLMAAFYFTESPVAVIVLGFLQGLTGSSWNVSALCYLSKIGEKMKKEGLVVGSYSSLAYIGVFSGLLVSGYVSQVFGTRAVFLLLGSAGLISTLLSSKYITE